MFRKKPFFLSIDLNRKLQFNSVHINVVGFSEGVTTRAEWVEKFSLLICMNEEIELGEKLWAHALQNIPAFVRFIVHQKYGMLPARVVVSAVHPDYFHRRLFWQKSAAVIFSPTFFQAVRSFLKTCMRNLRALEPKM